MANDKRVSTGIPGFDSLVKGGFYRGSLNMITGGPGAGKTIFALQYIYNGAVNYGERGIFITFEQPKQDLIEDAREFGWDFEELERLGRVKIISHSPYDMKKFSTGLFEEIKEFGAKRIVFDSTSVLGLAFSDGYQGFEVRKFLFELQSIIKSFGCTALITSEVVGGTPIDSVGGSLSRFSVEEFVSDSVISLHYGGLGGDSDRMIRVLKMRRTNHVRDLISLNITDKGIIVNSEENSSEQVSHGMPSSFNSEDS